jgi:hypothetical protein
MTSRKEGTVSQQVAKVAKVVHRLGDNSSSHRTYTGEIFSLPIPIL